MMKLVITTGVLAFVCQIAPTRASSVLELTPETFDKTVVQSSERWFVMFYAPWCGHCKKLKPIFHEAAAKLGNKLRFGKVDASKHDDLKKRFDVSGYPTLKLFENGVAKAYKGKRTRRLRHV